jgi:hypothetical protein
MYKKKNLISIIFLLFLIIDAFKGAEAVEIKFSSYGLPIIYYRNRVLLSYGPSPQNILTNLPEGDGNNITDWVEWAEKFKINHVRSYPPSSLVSEPAENIFQKSKLSAGKFDLERFNENYFDELRKACLLLNEKGFIVNLQLWQAVYWKKAWDTCYYNPENNVNPDISRHAGPGEFVTMENPKLLDHQKNYVAKILDATADIGNVFYDIMNEIGNGTGTNEEWVWEIIKKINEWEKINNINVLVTLNDEGGNRMGRFSLECPGLDLIIKDLGRYDEHIEAQLKYKKPTISIRNIDYDYDTKNRSYFAGEDNLEINTDSNLQIRGRKYWWRMFMAGVQIAGGYADAAPMFDLPMFDLKDKPTYRINTEAEKNFFNFKRFIDQVRGYKTLKPTTGVLSNHPVANSYCLQSTDQALIYLESPNGKAGFSYDRSPANLNKLLLTDGTYKGLFYFPDSGRTQTFSIQMIGGKGKLLIPDFKDDLAIFIQ